MCDEDDDEHNLINNLLYNLRSPKNQQQTLTDTSFVVRVSPRNALATKWMYRELRKKKQIPTKRKRERCIYLSRGITVILTTAAAAAAAHGPREERKGGY